MFYLLLMIVGIIAFTNVRILGDLHWVQIIWTFLLQNNRWVHSHCWRIRGLLSIFINIIIKTRLDWGELLCHLKSIAGALYFIDANFYGVVVIVAEIWFSVNWLIWLWCWIINNILMMLRLYMINIPALPARG